MTASVKIKPTRFKHLHNASMPMILVENRIDLLSASYLLSRFNNGTSINTVRLEAKAIRKFYEFLLTNNFDLFNRLAKLEAPNIGEIEQLHGYMSAHIETGELVNVGTFKHYFGTTQRFIQHWFSFYQSRVTDPEKLRASKIVLETMNQGFKINRNIPHNNRTKERVGLTPELQVLFLAVIDPNEENKLNPVVSQKVRWRNYCLFLTLMLSGNRKGESLGLRVSDFHLIGNDSSEKYFEIVKRDRTFDRYPRSEIPSVKTKGRIVGLDNIMVELFSHYIANERIHFRGSHASDYMFLSARDGQPLHPNTPNQIIDQIIAKFPVFKGLLTPHILRNTFHDLLSTALDENLEGMGPMRKQQIKATLQEYQGGWAVGSNMVAHYPKGSIQRRVAEMTQRIQSNILSETKDD